MVLPNVVLPVVLLMDVVLIVMLVLLMVLPNLCIRWTCNVSEGQGSEGCGLRRWEDQVTRRH